MSLSIDEADVARLSSVAQGQAEGRLLWLDGARTLALLGMIVFHFARDLEIFGVLAAGTTTVGGWFVFARLIAGSFLFIAGLSFVLAHRNGFRARAWARRLCVILFAAGLVSAATFVTFPQSFIYFGILHAIGFASVIGLIFLSVPFWLTGLSALAVAVIGSVLTEPLFQSVWLAWTGLSATVRPSLDFIPVIPWLGAFLFGMAVAQRFPLAEPGAAIRAPAPIRVVTWPGRHSLAVYLLHQPILLGLIWLGVAIQA